MFPHKLRSGAKQAPPLCIMFDPVDPKQSFPALERGILKYWQQEDTFKRSVSLRTARAGGHAGDPLNGMAKADREQGFSFYDGPPFATGLPHYGHLLAGTIKDVIPRYQTMRGKRVERRFGWDCHGLPIENIIEREHTIRSKKEIEEMGVKAFNDLCRTAVQRFAKEWRTVVERMGRWVDMDWDYRTMDSDYMESIWWVFKSLFDRKLMYEGHKPMHVCPRCVTPLSNFEVTQGYKDITDHSVIAVFELSPSPPQGGGGRGEGVLMRTGGGRGEGVFSDEREDQGVGVLAWTTTPWTLPGNLFLAVHPKTQYVTVTSEGKKYLVARDRVEAVFKGKEYAVEGTPVTGKSLIGKKYAPLFPYFADFPPPLPRRATCPTKLCEAERSGKRGVGEGVGGWGSAFRIVEGDFVTTEDGTGIVHIAPGFGEDDFNVGMREKVPILQHVGMDGKFTKEVTDFAGMDVKPMDDPTKTDKKVAEWLEKNGKLFSKEHYTHSYPHCWRCDSPLLNYATSSWFVAVEKIKEKMLDANSKTRWVPEHLRDGRFGKWLEGARDWAISRSRYWGTPLPIWRCDTTKEIDVIGSRDDLMSRMPVRFTKVTVLRHAESEGNVTPRYQGNVPGTDLTSTGTAQSKGLAELLKPGNIARIYCSPLARAIQTAQPLADATGAEIVIDERLREVEFGQFEGKSVDFSDLTFVKARRAHKLETGKVESIYHFPGMETWSQVQSRVKSFADGVLPRHRGEHIVIVTHADPALNFKHLFTREDPAKLCHQPYPRFATPESYFWDHDTEAQLDLHKETVDEIDWMGSEHDTSVHLTLLRHGETDWNVERLCQGQEGDRPLTAKGREQAKKAAQELKNMHFDGIIASDLIRTRDTADIIAKELNFAVMEYSPLLRERKFGQWVGQKLDDITAKHPLLVPSGEFGVHLETGTGGETLSQFLHRAEEAQKHVLKTYPGKTLLVVTHGGMIQAFALTAGRMSYREALQQAPGNCETREAEVRPFLERIPEVLDCWFESGSMPYAQSHYPFGELPSPVRAERAAGEGRGGEGRKKNLPLSPAGGRGPGGGGLSPGLPPGFPADFIAEGIDQTRGWFYTLIVLSSALFDQPAFMNCIVNGTVLAEDGKKMSKRLQNYPEPLEVVERHGADAVRFALMSSPAVRGEDLRFSERYVEEAVRSVLLPLWNTYSFFVTYANVAKWEATSSRRTSLPVRSPMAKAGGHPLDRWIRAEVQDLTNRMTAQLDDYDLSATCSELHETIDALTNWYVRLSRRRFAGKAGLHTKEEAMEEMHEQGRLDALSTLYDVLLTLSQLLAPFCPFVTEQIYLNLVPEEHGSIHLTDWPPQRQLSAAEEKLLRKTRLLRTVASLGLRIRSAGKIKLRQPLAKATVAVPPALLQGDAITPSEMELLQEELNVHAVDIVDDPGVIAERFAQVDARKVGPRLGERVQDILRAGKRGEFTVQEDGSVIILEEVLGPEEVAVMYRGREGEDVAADKGVVIALDMRITPELELQGKARDLIRAIQSLRKQNGLKLGNRIVLQIDGAEDVMKAHGETVLHATLATVGKVDGEGHAVELDGQKIIVKFKKV